VGFGFATVTPSGGSVNATSVAQAVWSYTPRSLTEIQNLVNAIQNNNPSLLSSLSDLQYVPAPYFAGQVSLTQVAAFIDNVVRNYGLVFPIANFITNNPYNLWTTNFVSSLAVNPYLTVTSLNMLLSNANMSANYAQFLLYHLAQNYYYNRWIETVTANAPSITFSANTTLSTNVLIAQSITIASGVTVTCGTRTCFFIAQAFNNQGAVVAYGGAGGVPATSPLTNYGGTGGGGIAVIAITAVLGTLNVSGGNGVTSTNTSGSGNGGTGTAGVFLIINGVTVPLGGTGGYSTNGYLGVAGINGGGGGGAWGDYGGPGGNATVYSFSSPNAMVTYILQGLSDWWLINVLGKAPSSTTPLAYMYGSGGGAGGAQNGVVNDAGGGGGGGGGEVVVYGYNIISGTINAAGGAGGIAYASGAVYPAGGGGGGGGGLVFVFYGATSGNVTANVANGTSGIGTTSPNNGLAGASGTAYIAAVTVNG
jgi:hypothetical protein